MKFVLKYLEQVKLFTDMLTIDSLIRFIETEFVLQKDSIEVTFTDEDGDNIMIISDQDVIIVESYFEGKEYVKLSVNGNKKTIAEDKKIEKIIQEVVPQIIKEEKQSEAIKEEQASEIIKIEEKQKIPEVIEEPVEVQIIPVQVNQEPQQQKQIQISKHEQQVIEDAQEVRVEEQPIKKQKKVVKQKKQTKISKAQEMKKLMTSTINTLVQEKVKELIPQLRKKLNLGSIPRQEQPQLTHQNLSCSQCKVKPIKGIRYDCPICNYVICEKCEVQFQHEHNLLKIRHIEKKNAKKASAKYIQKLFNFISMISSVQSSKPSESKTQPLKKEQLAHVNSNKKVLVEIFHVSGTQANEFALKHKDLKSKQIIQLFAQKRNISSQDLQKTIVQYYAKKFEAKFKLGVEESEKFVSQNYNEDYSQIVLSYKKRVEQIKEEKRQQKIQQKLRMKEKKQVNQKMKKQKIEQKTQQIKPSSSIKKESSQLKKQVKPIVPSDLPSRKSSECGQLKGQKLEILHLMIEFFGEKNKIRYIKFIEENEKHSKQDIIQLWADKSSFIH